MIDVIDREGKHREIDVQPGRKLMPQLRPLKLGVVGLCNGNMACGTCHVYVEESRLDELEPPSEDERDMLNDLSTKRPNSRLTCQIEYRPQLAGITLSIAPRS